MRVGRSDRGEDGSTLPELLVAASILVLAGSVLGVLALGPTLELSRTATPDPRIHGVEVVGLELARITRAARPLLRSPAVAIAEEKHLGSLVVVGSSWFLDSLLIDDGRITFERRALPLDAPRSTVPHEADWLEVLMTHTLVEGVDDGASGFVYSDRSGRELVVGPDGLGAPERAAIGIVGLRLRVPGPDGRGLDHEVLLQGALRTVVPRAAPADLP